MINRGFLIVLPAILRAATLLMLTNGSNDFSCLRLEMATIRVPNFPQGGRHFQR
jgi:hypothetical protein